jgi:hypothetical protein
MPCHLFFFLLYDRDWHKDLHIYKENRNKQNMAQDNMRESVNNSELEYSRGSQVSNMAILDLS